MRMKASFVLAFSFYCIICSICLSMRYYMLCRGSDCILVGMLSRTCWERMGAVNWYPNLIVNQVTCITPGQLKIWDVQGLILDIDNTLTTHDNPIPNDGVAAWLSLMQDSGMKMIVLSNNSKERVEPFAKVLGLDFISNGKKPLHSGFKRCEEALGISCQDLCMIGDQLLTDIWGGRMAGCKTVLVRPIQLEDMIFFKAKRSLERVILKNFPGGSNWACK